MNSTESPAASRALLSCRQSLSAFAVGMLGVYLRLGYTQAEIFRMLDPIDEIIREAAPEEWRRAVTRYARKRFALRLAGGLCLSAILGISLSRCGVARAQGKPARESCLEGMPLRDDEWLRSTARSHPDGYVAEQAAKILLLRYPGDPEMARIIGGK